MSTNDAVHNEWVAVVLAGSRGLGAGCARELARSGYRLLLTARSEEQLEKTAEELRAEGADVATTTADVTSPEQIARVFEVADETYGRLDALVANAGGPPPGNFAKMTEDDWRTGFELTLMSAVRAIRHAIPRMEANGFGRIVILGSSSVRAPIPNLIISNVYRPGLAGLVKSLAVELAPSAITVNMVSPGRIGTARTRQLDEAAAAREGIEVDAVEARSVAKIPMGRYGRPEELGALVAFLASEAAGYVTGQSMLVDGGMVPTLP